MNTIETIVESYLAAKSDTVRNHLEEAMLRAFDKKLVTVIKKYAACGDSAELHQIAKIGLIKALRKYNPDRDTKFATFAYYYINGFIKNQLRDNGSLIKHPGYFRDFLLKRNSTADKLITKLGRPATEEEIATAMSMSVQDYISRMELVHASATSVELMDEKAGMYEEESESLYDHFIMAGLDGKPLNQGPDISVRVLIDELLDKHAQGYSVTQFAKEYKISLPNSVQLVNTLKEMSH